jgi:hypothetical protein
MTSGTFARGIGHTTVIVEIDKSNPVFGVCEHFIVKLDGNSLVRYVGRDRDVLITKRFSEIGERCFCCVTGVSTIRFESGSRISVFPVAAFAICGVLKSISIPATVEVISADCFCGCMQLNTVTFETGSRVSVFGDRAFSDCYSLAAICLPSSVRRIGSQCFSGCLRLATITVESGGALPAVGVAEIWTGSRSFHVPLSLAGQI